MKKRLYRIGWATFGIISLGAGGVQAAGTGLNSSVCLSLGLLLGLALLPPEMLIDLAASRVKQQQPEPENNES